MPPHRAEATWKLCSLTVISGQVHNTLHVSQIQGSASCSGELHLQRKQELEQEQKDGSGNITKGVCSCVRVCLNKQIFINIFLLLSIYHDFTTDSVLCRSNTAISQLTWLSLTK